MIPRELILLSWEDFLKRHKTIKIVFDKKFKKKFDLTLYRNYLLEVAPLSQNSDIQFSRAEKIWEYLMGDLEEIKVAEYIYRRNRDR